MVCTGAARGAYHLQEIGPPALYSDVQRVPADLRMVSVMKSPAILAIGTAALGLCACVMTTASGRYIVTAQPVDLGLRNGSPFCVAVDAGDPHGVWWWEPGKTGCSSRSIGPTVMTAEASTVTVTGRAIDVRFRIQLITGADWVGPTYKEVAMVIEDGRARVPATGSDVPTVQRNDLEVPESLR